MAMSRRWFSNVSGVGKNPDVESLSTTKVKDVKNTMRRAPKASLSLWKRYCDRYLTSNQRSFAPYLHIMLLVGGLGYAFHYPHMKHEHELARANIQANEHH